MDFKKTIGIALVFVAVLIALQTNQARASYQAETVVSDLSVPWAMAWLPSGDMLVTERSGEILRVRQGNIVGKLQRKKTQSYKERKHNQGCILGRNLIFFNRHFYQKVLCISSTHTLFTLTFFS